MELFDIYTTASIPTLVSRTAEKLLKTVGAADLIKEVKKANYLFPTSKEYRCLQFYHCWISHPFCKEDLLVDLFYRPRLFSWAPNQLLKIF